MEAAVLGLDGAEISTKTLESPAIVTRRAGADLPDADETAPQPALRKLIQRPGKSLWRQFRVKLVPLIVFLSTVTGIFYFWPPF